MRLARHGRKRYAYYHIVIADSRAPRDGRYVERIGSYNPNTNPATINLDFDKAYDWLLKGAQPTDTVKTILSNEGVLYKKHLMGGVKKGAFDEAEAEKRFDKWVADKNEKLQVKLERLSGDAAAAAKKQLEAEVKINEERAKAIAAKNAELAAAASKAEAQEEVAEEATEEVVEETAKEVTEETVEETVAEAIEEVTEEVVEETTAEVTEETVETEETQKEEGSES